MSTAGKKNQFEPWKRVDALEDEQPDSFSTVGGDNDNVTWPPVIARIRDLDRPAAVATAPPGVLAETKTPSVSLRAKISQRQRRNRQMYSRLIALAGIVIVLVAVLPFLRMHEKSSTDTSSTALQPAPPAPSVGVAPILSGSTASKTAPSEKLASQPPSIPSVSPTPPPAAPPTPPAGGAPRPSGVAAAAPPLSTAIEKQESTLNYGAAGSSPAIKANPQVDLLKEQMATQPGIRTGEVLQPTNAAGIPIAAERPSSPADRVVVQGESCPWDPNATTVEAPVDNRGLYEADARARYRSPYNFVPDYRMPPTANGPNAAPYGQNPPINRPNSSPYGQNPATSIQNPVPYAQNPRVNGQNPTYGQNPGPYGQNPAAYGQNPAYGQSPASNVRGGTVTPQASPQNAPRQPVPQYYPSANPSLSGNPAPGTAGATWQQGGVYPPATNGNNPNAGYPDAANTGGGSPDDYHYPASR
jgi:hypothetical protein